MTTQSFEQTIIDRAPFLYRVAQKLTRSVSDAEDLVQETILLALRHREKFAEGTRMEAWLYTILRNTYINHYRKQKKQREATSQLTYRQRSLQESLTNEGLSRMLLRTMRQRIEQLPIAYSTPLKLALAGHRYREIAQLTGQPLGTVKSQIHLGKKLLKTSLQHLVD